MREFHRIIVEQARHMRGLISDLLDTGRIESGTLSVAPEPSELAELVERARTTFVSGGGRHAVLVDLPSGLPPVMADRRRIVQVLNNLLANAAKHAPESTPIRVAAACEGAHVAVSVSDQGRGVAPERLPHLFRRHAAAAENAAAGHGLGLALCKGLVEAHGGRIRAESAGAGHGTTFTFTVPAAGEAGAGEAGRAAGPSPAAERGEPPRILVVDDDPQMLRFVRGALSAAGYAPLVTGAPEDLQRIIRTEKPGLVLLDLLLPGCDGIELLAQIPELADLPVIFISAYGRDETVARVLESGAADYIAKPFSPTELWPGCARRVLSLDAGRVVTFETLLRRVLAERDNADANLVRIFVKNLRRKLGLGGYGGDHWNSLILSHAYYLAIEGGTNASTGLTVTGAGVANRPQVERIFFWALAELMPAETSLPQAADALRQAAADLASGTAVQQAIVDALRAVGLRADLH